MPKRTILPFKVQIKSLPVEDLLRIENTILNSPNLTCINEVSRRICLAVLRNELNGRRGGGK